MASVLTALVVLAVVLLGLAAWIVELAIRVLPTAWRILAATVCVLIFLVVRLVGWTRGCVRAAGQGWRFASERPNQPR